MPNPELQHAEMFMIISKYMSGLDFQYLSIKYVDITSKAWFLFIFQYHNIQIIIDDLHISIRF